MELNMSSIVFETEVVLTTPKVHLSLLKMDRKNIGTEHYMGIAYFWEPELKYYLRVMSPRDRKKVHDLFIKNNIPLIKTEFGKYFQTNQLAETICVSVFNSTKK